MMSARSLSARRRFFTTSALGTLACALLWSPSAHAQLVPGAAPAQSNGTAPVINQSGTTTDVTLGGSRTVIDWDRFDINNGDTANFIFANRSDIVLNRVGGAGSTINGDLNGMVGAGGPASGNIWIYNANGVVIGANARINTGGLLVTTAAIDRADDATPGGFLDGTSTSFGFTGAATGAGITVRNGAQVNSYGGAIALIAPVVSTEAGSAVAARDGGNILYGAASKYKVSFRPTGADDLDLIGFEVAGSVDGTGESGGIALGGATSGNRVFAAVVSKSGIVSSIVSSGTVTATSVATDESGAIVLLGNHNLVGGAAGGMVANAGTSEIKVDTGSTLTAPAVSLISSDSITNHPSGVISAVGGTIDLLAKNGVIFGFGKLNTGTLTAEAYGRIYLSGTNNVSMLGGLRNTTDEIVFSNNASLDIAGDIVAGGEANISVNGVASGNGLIRAATATLSGGGMFNLDSATTLRYISAYAGNLTVNSNGNLLIDLSGAGNDYGNTVTLNAASGGIRQTSGDALVGSMIVNARDAIDLGALNQFSSITANATGGGDILLRGAISFAFAGNTTGGMSVDAGGRVTVGGALSVGTIDILAGGDIDLNRSVLDVGSYRSLISSGGNISITTDSTINIGGNVTAAANHDVNLTSNTGGINQTAGTIAGRQLNIQAADSIIQNSAAVMNGRGFVGSIVQAGDNLILAGANRLADYADVTLGWGAGSDVTYRSAYSIFFQTTGANIGALNLIVDNGSIQQGSAFTANSFSARASGNIDIGTSVDNSIARLGDISSSAGEVRLRVGANNPLAVDGTISSASRVIFTARGAVSGSGKFATPGLYLGLIGGGTVNVAGSTNLLEFGASNGDATVRADDSLTLSGAVAANGHNLMLIAGTGGITQTGGSFIGTGTLTATAAGNIDLQSEFNSFSSFSGTSTGNGSIKLRGFNPDFAVNTGGEVVIRTAYDATATGTLRAGTLDITSDSGSININTTGDAVGSYVNLLASNGSVSVTTTGTINLAGDVSALNGGTASLTSTGGAIAQASGTIAATSIALQANTTIGQGSGATLRSTDLSLTSGGNVTLGGANDFTALTDLAVGGDLTLRNLGNIDLDPTNSGGYSADGQLTLTSDTGDITAGNSIIASKLSASAANGDILFGGSGHQISTLGAMTAQGQIDIGSSRSLRLTGDITGATVTLSPQGGGGLSQDAGTKITAGTLNVSTDGNIVLDQANAVTTVGGLNANLFTTGHNISFRNASNITLGGVVDASGGTLRLTSNTGGISQNSGAGIYVLANQLFLSGASDVLLNSASNNVATLGDASSTNGGILYRDANGFDIAGNITATNGGASLRTSGAGTITQSAGIIDVDYLGVLTAGSGNSVTLNQANRIHRLIATSGSGTLSINSTTDLLIDQNVYFGTISLSSGGAITQSNTGSFGAGTANLSAVTGINLPGASFVGNNGIQNFGTITNTTSGGINIVSYSGSHISLTGNISAAGQTVSITDVAGYILQTGGVITADTLTMSATGGINVGGNNQVSNLGAMTGPGVTFANAGSFNVTRSIGVGAAILLTSNSGAITQNAGTTLTADTIGLTAGTTIGQGAGATLHSTNLSLNSGGNVTLGEANNFSTLTDLAVGGDLTLRNLGNINLSPILGGTGGYRSGGALTLISDTGNILTTNSGISTSRLNASAAGSISLDGTIASLGTITAGQSILLTTYNGSMDLTGNVTGRNISLYGNTGLSQSGGIIDADRLNVITNGNISLTGANRIDVVGRLDTDQFDSGAGHDITLRNVGAIMLDYQIEAPDGTVTLTSDTGGISQTSFSNLFAAGTLNASAAGDIVLDYAGNNIGRVTGLRTSSGNIIFNEANGFDIYGDIATPGSVSLSSGGAIETYTGHLSADTLSVTAGGDVSFNAIGNIKLGAVDTSGAGVTPGGNFFLSTDGDIALTGAVTTGDRNLILDSSGGAITTNGGTISANYNGATGVTYATAVGGIDLVSAGNAVIWATSTGGGNINLTGDADIGFMVNTGGDLTVTAGGWAGNNGDVIARSVGITAGTGIALYDQTVNIDIGSYRYLTVADGSIDIENQGDINLDGNVTAGGGTNGNYIRLNSSQNSILQNSGTISGYSVELNAAQSVLQDTDAKIVTGDYGLSFRATNVSLIGANEFPWVNSYTVSQDLTLRTVGNLDMSGNANQAGSNRYTTLISDTGNIVGGVIDSDRLSATATNGSLSFTYGNNHIRSLGDLTARNTGGTDIDIFTDSLLGLTGNITGGGVKIYATQGINQTAGAITADRLWTGTSGSLLLGGANDFGALLDIGHPNGGTVTIRNRGDIALPSTPTTFGTLTLTSDSGKISQTAAITATTLNVHAATGIDLSNTANNFTMLTGLATTSGDIRIADVGGLAIEGNIAAAAGTVALVSTGNITTGTTTVGSVTTPHGKVDADTLTVSATNATVYAEGDIKLGASAVSSGFTLVADGSIDLTASSNFNGASLIATAGSITQSGGILTGNTVLTGARGSITLEKNNNLRDFGGTSQAGGNVTFNNVGTSLLALSLNTTGNAVVTAAGDVLGAYINVNDLSLTAGSIDLRTNVDVNSFSKLVASYGDVLVTNGGSFSIAGEVAANRPGLRTIDLFANGGGISQTAGTIAGHYVSLRGAGDLIQSGTARIDSNAAYFSGGNVLLGGANNIVSGDTDIVATANLTLRNAGSIDLTAMGGYTAGGVLSLISDNGSITSGNAVTALALTALAANGAVSFSHADNLISEIRGLSAGTNATVRSRNGGFTLTGDIDVGGTLSLQAGTGINQTGGRIRATTLDAQLYQTMTTGSVLLGGANDIDNLYVLAASGGGDLLFRDTDGFRVTYAVVGNRVTLTSDAGAITQASGFMDGVQANQLTVSAADGISLNNQWNGIRTILGLTNTGSGGIDVGGGGINMILNGNVTAAGQAVSLAARNASLTQAGGSIIAYSLSASAATGISLASTTNNVSRLAELSNTTSGGIRVNDATGDLDISGTVTAAGQAVRFDTAGRLTQSAALGTYSALTINAGTGLILDQANNFGAATLSLSSTSGDITVRNTGNLNVPALSAAGATIRLISDTGTINQVSGALTANTLFAEARREISLSGSNVITNVGGLANTSGTISFRDVDGFNIIGDIRGSTTTGERVNLTAGGMGDIVQTGGAIVVDKLRATAGGNLTLDGNANAFVNVEVLSAGGDIRLRAQDSFVLGHTVDAGGTATLTSTNGFIGTDIGSIGHVRADALYVNAATGIDINLPGNITPKVSLISAAGNIRYTTQGAMELLALKTSGRGIVSADALTQSGAIEVGSLDALATDIRFDMTGNRIGSITYAAATGGDVVIADEDGFDIAGNLFASGAISLTAGGAGSITQSDGTITAPTVSLVAGGDIILDRANAGGVYNARSAVGGTITLRNAGNLTVNAITAQNGTVNLTSNTGSVGQLLVPGNSIWAGKLNVDAVTDIELAAQNFTDLLGDLNAGGSIRYNSFNTLGLDGDIRAGGGVTFGISGYLGQYSGTIAASHLDVTARGIALIGANDVGSTTASRFSAGDDITFRSVNSILLGAVDTPGLLSLTSDGGDIRQTVAFTADRLDAMAAGDIVLDRANAVTTLNDITAGGAFVLNGAGALELDGRITAPDRVALNVVGDIIQIGNIIITDRLEVTSGPAGAAGIRLLNQNHVGEVSFDAGGRDIRFRNQGDIAINAINSPAGTVELISNVGKITQQVSGGLVVGSLILDAANGVQLYNADNQIARLDVVSRGDVSILTGTSGWGGILDVARIDAAGRSVSLHNGVSGITGGNITAASLNVFAVNSIDLGTANDISGTVRLSSRDITFTNTGDLVLEGLIGTLGNAVLRSEQGAIGMTNGAIFATDGLTAYGRGGVVLAGSIHRIDGLSAGPGADVSVSSDHALDIAGAISARNVELLSNAPPNAFSPTGGKITQSGGIITADQLIARAWGDVTLDRSNQIAALDWTVSTTGNIAVTSVAAMDLTGAIVATNGSIILDADAISQSGGYIETAALRARAAGSLALDGENRITPAGTIELLAGQDIAFRNSGSFTVGTIAIPGGLRLASTNGSITQTVATSISAGTLAAAAAGEIYFDQANDVGTLGALAAGGDIAFRNAGDLVLGGDIVATGYDVALASNTGAITQTAGTITARGLGAIADGAITLGGANNVSNLLDVTAGGDILYRNAGALMLLGDISAVGHDVTLGADSGALLQMLFNSGIITADRLNARAGGALNLNHANRVNELGNYAASSGLAGFTNDGSFVLTRDVSGEELVLTALSGGIGQASGTITTGSILATASESIELGGANLVSGAGPVRLNSSNGNVTFRALGDFTLDFGSAAGTFDVTSSDGSIGQSGAITADRINARAGGNIALTSNNAVAALGFLTGEDIAFTAAGDLLLTDDIDAGGTVRLVAASGSIRQDAGIVTADRFTGTAGGYLRLGGANRIVALGDLAAGGTLWLENDAALTIDGAVSSALGTTIQAKGLTIGASGTVTSAATGDAITLASDGLFRNLGGAGALSAANGRWLVYSQASGNAGASNPGNDFGGLAGKSFYGAAYDFEAGAFAMAPNAGNRFVYGYRPVLTVRPGDTVMTYDGQTPVIAAAIAGLVNGDRAADAWSGAALISGAGRNAGSYTLTAAPGTLVSDMNYDFAFGTGTLRIDPRALTATLAANGRVYDGTVNATGTLGLSGMVAGDTVGVTSDAFLFDSRNAGTRTATANGIALTGADAGNYVVNSTATDLADIFARALTATLAANGRIYDGTTNATGTLGLSGVIAGDTVGVTGSYAFDTRNAGTGKTVTASGITLTGTDAGNYVVSSTATDLADIFARALTATLTANDRIYDGTTNATGTLGLGGLVAGDTVGAAGTLAFDTRNAGTGKTVTASGITLTGADAGNYVVNAAATDLADIFARSLTATLTANGRIYDGTTNATGTLGLSGMVAGDTVGVTSDAFLFDSRNAGTRTATANGIALTGADAGNYVVNTTATDLADIFARAINATFTANDRIYDGTTGATGALAIEGVIAGDTVGAIGSYAFDTRNAGTGKTVTASGITLIGADAGNYVVNATATDLADIAARAITATFTANDRTYDGTTGATGSLDLDGVIAGDAIGSSATLAFDTRNAGTGKAVTASGITLTGTDAGNYVVNSTATDLADIFARALTATLTANGRIYDGTTDATGTLGLSGVIAGDTVGATGSYTFDTRNAGTGKTVTASGITLTGADAGNYVVNATTTDLADIAARAITATFTANDRTYDGTTGATGSLDLDGVIAGDAIGSSATLAFDTRNAGTGKTVTASGITLTGADAGNYVVNSTATDLADIFARALTATLTANDRIYDGTTNATGTLGLGGLVAGDAVGVTGGLVFDTRNAGTGKTVTASGITLTGADAGNYVVNAAATDLADIFARSLTATLAANGRVYDGTVNATGTLGLSGMVAGDTVGVTSDAFLFDSRNAGTRTATANGIALTGADAGNYVVNSTATDLADIFARAITATLTANDRIYDGTTGATGALAIEGVIAGDTVGATGSYAFDTRNAGTGKTVTASGITLTGTDAGNYVVNAAATDLADIFARAITATLTANGRVYDGTTNATGTLGLGGLVAGDNVGVTGSLAFDTRNAGTGKTVTASGIALTGADAGNYVVNSTATDLADIFARALTATLTANGRIYDGTTNATGTLGLSGVIAGDTVGVTGSYAFDTRNAGTGKTVTASGITLTGADAGNYVVNAAATDLTDIFARAITATLTANGRIYDGTTNATGTLGLGGLVAGDMVGAAGTLAFDTRNAGMGKTVTASGITLIGADAGNYVVNATATDLADIAARAITATFTANDRTYDGTTGATGSLDLDGVIAGDAIGSSATLAFDTRNAGTGKAVTASGITLTGADAGNYVVNSTATDLADIFARAITATLTANGRVYDGTTNATGALGLGGLVAGDNVGVTGNLAFDTRNAGTSKTVTASGITLIGADAGNYVVNTTATDLADIFARASTATFTANDRIYDGTTGATGTLAIEGVIAGDTIGATGSYAFDTRNAGTGKTVTASGITLTGADAGNYIVNSSATDLADIFARALTATLAANGRIYDGTTNATGTLGLSGVIAGDTVGATGSYAFDTRNAGTGKTVTASGIALTGADAGNYVVNTTAADLADIAARAITATLTANGRIYDGTANATGTLALGGLVAGDTVGVTGGLTFDTRNAGTGKTVTASGITLTGADAGNYVVNGTATDIADIFARAINATLTANSRVYDGTTNATGALGLSGVIAGDTVGATGNYAFDTRNAGTGKTVTASGITLTGADAGNYAVNAAATDLADIFARAITATLTANDRIYDGTANATGTLGLGGLVAGDMVGAAGTLAFDTRNAGMGKTVTASGITLIGADAGNYVVNSSATDLADIRARAVTARLAAADRTYDGTTAATGTLAIEGVLAGDIVGVTGSIRFDSRNAGDRVATAADLTLTGVDSGNYIIVGPASDIATIARRAITGTARADNRVYDGTANATGRIALDGMIAGDDLAAEARYAFADANAGMGRSVTVSDLTLGGADAGNYTLTLDRTPVLADILRRSVTVTADDLDKLFGRPDPVLTYRVTGGSLVANDGFTGGLARAPGEQVGAYAIGQGNLALSSNYDLTVTPGTLTIRLTHREADVSDVLKMWKRRNYGFALDRDPSANLEGHDGGAEDR